MATATVDTGTGTTITFGTSSSFTPKIRSIKINGEEVAVIDTTHLGTTGSRTAMLGDLKGLVTLEVEHDYNPSLTYPTGVSETITVTMPIPAGGTTGATLYGTGSLTNHNADIPLEDKMTASFTISFLAGVTRTVAS